VLVPPDLVALIVPAENEVQVAVAVDVGEGAAGLGSAALSIDDVLRPAILRAPQPDDGGSLRALSEDDVVHAVAVEIEYHAGRLLRAAVRNRQLAVLAGEMPPADPRRLRAEREGADQGECDEEQDADQLRIHRGAFVTR